MKLKKSTSKEETLQNCSFVKTILMFLVILGHSAVFWRGTWVTTIEPIAKAPFLAVLASWLVTFHTYAFVLVSGYIFAFKMGENTGGYKTYPLFMKNKAKRLLVPYLFVALTWVVPISEYLFHWDGLYLVERYVLCISPSQLWFLWMLFWVFVIVWPLYRWIAHNAIAGYAIVIMFYGVCIIGARIFPNVFCIWTAFRYVLFFYLGIRIRVRQNDGDNIMNLIPVTAWIVLDVILFLAYSAMGNLGGIMWRMIHRGIGILLNMVGALMAFFVLQSLSYHVKWTSSNIFKIVACNTMPIYLFHEQIIYIVLYLFNGINPYVHACMNFILGSMIAFAISRILMKWKVTRFLIGEK